MYEYETPRVPTGPRRQINLFNFEAVLPSAKVKTLVVRQELREEEELWNEFLDIRRALTWRQAPSCVERVKSSVR